MTSMELATSHSAEEGKKPEVKTRTFCSSFLYSLFGCTVVWKREVLWYFILKMAIHKIFLEKKLLINYNCNRNTGSSCNSPNSDRLCWPLAPYYTCTHFFKCMKLMYQAPLHHFPILSSPVTFSKPCSLFIKLPWLSPYLNDCQLYMWTIHQC